MADRIRCWFRHAKAVWLLSPVPDDWTNYRGCPRCGAKGEWC